ncbi:M20 family metallopeptidase [Nocardiopsis sp. JB363]|uniref:M20 metallopeptidase family protein n=1 Tax=Nocardiopsis sp. JB363 TaxID=1434837 RepID=UPI00097B85B6|nr:M20 family metallopeptidase [Nocardiopsis sp. JB363]SIO88749.1 N-acetyl-L,L-diaminopimelate deacetylase [Nocardiopsis sp. JB363]
MTHRPAPEKTGGPEPAVTRNPFTPAAETLLPELRTLRRSLHSRPEVGLHLPETQRAVLDALEGLDLEIVTGTSLSSVVAVLRGGAAGDAGGPVVLLRGDMDALPVEEATGLDFAATNGAMHACGHDLHVAGLVGAAELLHGRRDELPGTVIFMFQPGEEGFGGGRIMIDEGVLDAAGERPVAAYAIHVDATTPYGRFVTRSGPIMAGVSTLRIRFEGTGGHAAMPHLAVDPVPVAAQAILAVQSFAARRIPAGDPAVITIGPLSSDSSAGNVLARSVSMEANMRHFSEGTLALLRDELPELLRGLAKAHGCAATVEFVPSYPATVNDAHETAEVVTRLSEVHGPERVVTLAEPAMASEDFSYVLQRVPGTLVFLGALPEGVPPEVAAPMHSEGARFDDGVLGLHAAALADLAWNGLERASAPSPVNEAGASR